MITTSKILNAVQTKQGEYTSPRTFSIASHQDSDLVCKLETIRLFANHPMYKAVFAEDYYINDPNVQHRVDIVVLDRVSGAHVFNLEVEMKRAWLDEFPYKDIQFIPSATAAMHVADHLSYDGEMCNIIAVDVPYPDEAVTPFLLAAKKKFTDITHKNILLVEAGIIHGGNYTWLTDLLAETTQSKVITSMLYENIYSKFKSDCIARYYDAKFEELTFYYEKYNKHWL